MKLSESFCETISIFPESGLVLGSLGVVLLTDIVHSAFLLGFVPACTAPPYLLLDSDFLAAAQVLIYVGAVNVLLVFAVMLINKEKIENSSLSRTIGDGISSAICIGIFLSLDNIISNTSWSEVYSVARSDRNEEMIAIDNIRRLGSELLTKFFIPFELISIILLVTLVGAITLARTRETINSERKILRSEKKS